MSGADAGRQGIARIHRHVHYAAALHAVFRTPRASRKNLPLKITVFVRIGVNNAAYRAMLRRHFGFDAAPGTAIPRDHDSPFHRDAQAFELLVIFGNAVVHVHERPGHVAVDRVGVVSGELFVVLAGGGVCRNGRLL